MAVAEADCEGGDVGPVFEEAERHDWVHGQFPFVQEKEAEDDQTENDEADDSCTGPWVRDAAIFET